MVSALIHEINITNPLHITEKGLQKLKDQFKQLELSLPDLIKETARTAAYGDRSENAEYQAAKSALRRAHRQILTLKDQIKRAVIIKPSLSASGVIQIGSTVVLEASGARLTFQIVGPHETDPAKGRISYQSPLGAALMNRKKGDIIVVHLPTGSDVMSRVGGKSSSQKYRILEIL